MDLPGRDIQVDRIERKQAAELHGDVGHDEHRAGRGREITQRTEPSA
jgi:hypothetical protein